jgi:hypothetical protein
MAWRMALRAGCDPGDEYPAKVFGEWKQEDFFYWLLSACITVQLAAALRAADVDPVSSEVTSSSEALPVHEGFEECGAVAVCVLPVTRELAA